MGEQERPNEHASVVDRFSRIAPEDFTRELATRWDALEQIKDRLAPVIAEQVGQRAITPVEGLGIFSCLTAQLLGYAQFHGEATGADMLSALRPAVRERELAGTR